MSLPTQGRLIGWLVTSQVLFSLGCGGEPAAEPTEISLSRLAIHYGKFTTAHRGNAPATEADLRAFIVRESPAIDVDSLFRSERDGRPYVVHYSSAAKARAKAKTNVVIAYETEGSRGRRLVALATADVQEMDEPAFRQAIAKK